MNSRRARCADRTYSAAVIGVEIALLHRGKRFRRLPKPGNSDNEKRQAIYNHAGLSSSVDLLMLGIKDEARNRRWHDSSYQNNRKACCRDFVGKGKQEGWIRLKTDSDGRPDRRSIRHHAGFSPVFRLRRRYADNQPGIRQYQKSTAQMTAVQQRQAGDQ